MLFVCILAFLLVTPASCGLCSAPSALESLILKSLGLSCGPQVTCATVDSGECHVTRFLVSLEARNNTVRGFFLPWLAEVRGDLIFADSGTNEVGFARLETVSGKIAVSGNALLSAVSLPSLKGHVASIDVNNNAQLARVLFGATDSSSLTTGDFLFDANPLLTNISSTVQRTDRFSVVFADKNLSVALRYLEEAKGIRIFTVKQGSLTVLLIPVLKIVGTLELVGFDSSALGRLQIYIATADAVIFERIICGNGQSFSFPSLSTVGYVRLTSTFTGTYGGSLLFYQLKKISGSFTVTSSNMENLYLPLLESIGGDWSWSDVRSLADGPLNLAVPSLTSIGGALNVLNLYTVYGGPIVNLLLPSLSTVGGSVWFTNLKGHNLNTVDLSSLSSVCGNAGISGALVFDPLVDFVICPDLIDAHRCTIPPIRNVTFPQRCSSSL